MAQPIAKNAVIILINLSNDDEVIRYLAEDDALLESMLRKITDIKDPTANEVGMLLANLAKSNTLKRALTLKRSIPASISSSAVAMDQLMDCFVKGAEGKVNKAADFDYLAYFFADISKHEEGRKYFTERQDYDGVVPITKLTVFTEHDSHVRRKGVASTIKNVAFEIPSHPSLFAEDEVNLLPYVLLPLAGSEEFSEEESAAMPPDLQLLPPDKARDADKDILVTHLETLLLLTTTREGREVMREKKVYPIVRETHLHVEDDEVREACDRLVQMLLRDEEGEGAAAVSGERVEEVEDEDEKIVEIL
ncbi:MAG: hypothetical protein Q9160_005402 [Pyrenula sp. 1 TL-2023]